MCVCVCVCVDLSKPMSTPMVKHALRAHTAHAHRTHRRARERQRCWAAAEGLERRGTSKRGRIGLSYKGVTTTQGEGEGDG